VTIETPQLAFSAMFFALVEVIVKLMESQKRSQARNND
jgi:hypothetical protein